MTPSCPTANWMPSCVAPVVSSPVKKYPLGKPSAAPTHVAEQRRWYCSDPVITYVASLTTRLEGSRTSRETRAYRNRCTPAVSRTPPDVSSWLEYTTRRSEERRGGK